MRRIVFSALVLGLVLVANTFTPSARADGPPAGWQMVRLTWNNEGDGGLATEAQLFLADYFESQHLPGFMAKAVSTANGEQSIIIKLGGSRAFVEDVTLCPRSGLVWSDTPISFTGMKRIWIDWAMLEEVICYIEP
jgi:hypothetical protein